MSLARRSSYLILYILLAFIYIFLFHSNLVNRLLWKTHKDKDCKTPFGRPPWETHRKPPPMGNHKVPDERPKERFRKFHSDAIEQLIQNVTSSIKDPDLAQLFANILPSTLDTTVMWHDDNPEKPRSFIVTGDIHALWLRDSTNQVMPYIPYAKEDTQLRSLLLGLLYVQSEFIIDHPYANAFLPPLYSPLHRIPNHDAMKDKVRPTPDFEQVWESKFELDSLAAFLKLSRKLYEFAGIDDFLNNEVWKSAVYTTLQVMTMQQMGTEEDHRRPTYRFQRQTSTATETLSMSGIGEAVRRCGLIKSHFRPSDDATTFPFLIPSNAMAAVELEKLGTILKDSNPHMSERLGTLGQQVRQAILDYGVVPWRNPDTGKYEMIFAYEVDGYGSHHIMDDANIPSLLSLPYLEFLDVEDETYQRTRRVLLSNHNKYYFQGKSGWGIGGPHVGWGYIWPMSTAMTILTSTNDDEIKASLNLLVETTANTGLIHEAYWRDDARKFTREWFAWACSLSAEAILKIYHERPHLIRDTPDSG